MAEIKIAGTEYRVEPLGAKDAYALLAKLLRIAGPGGKKMPGIQSLYESSEPQTVNFANAAALSAASDILAVHGDNAYVDLKSDVLSLAQAKRPSGIYEQVDPDLEFVGDLESAETLFDFVMEVQFGNFSKGSKAYGHIDLAMLLAKHLFRMQKPSK